MTERTSRGWLGVLILALLGLLAFLQYRLWWAGGNGGGVAALQAQVDGQARENQGLQQRNDALAAEVCVLSDDQEDPIGGNDESHEDGPDGGGDLLEDTCACRALRGRGSPTRRGSGVA